MLLNSVNIQIGFAQVVSETEALREEVKYLEELIKLLRLDIQAVKKGQSKLEKEVEEIKALLRSRRLHAQHRSQEVAIGGRKPPFIMPVDPLIPAFPRIPDPLPRVPIPIPTVPLPTIP